MVFNMKNSGDETMAGTKDASALSGEHVVDPSQGIDVGAGAVHSITLIDRRGYGACVSFQ
jgi:hypothetical protein